MLFDVVGPVRLAEKKEVAFDRISKIFVNGYILYILHTETVKQEMLMKIRAVTILALVPIKGNSPIIH